MTIRKILPIMLGAALSACTTGPDYTPPVLSSAAIGPFVSAAPGMLSGAAPDDIWWRLYDDPALDALIEQAFVANTDLRVAIANLKAAQAIAAEARNARLPSTTVTGNATYGRNQPPLYFSGDRLTFGGGFEASYEVDLFGRVSRSIEAARADADARAFARDAVQVRVAASVTDAYLTACTSAQAIGVVRSSIALAADSARIVGLQEKAGSVAALDVERAQGAVAQARASLAPLENQRQAALFELAALLGLPPSQIPEAAARCGLAPSPHRIIPVGDGAGLLRRRPDVAQAERQLAAATARIGVATADLYPKISLGASVAQSGGEGVSARQGLRFGVGPLLSFSIPNMGAARARIRQSEARSQAALASFDGVVLNALKETEQALTAYASEQRRRADLGEAEKRAERAFKLADQRYRAGSIAYIDAIVAQREWIDTRLARVVSDQQLASNLVAIFRVLGGGWGEDPVLASSQSQDRIAVTTNFQENPNVP